MTEAIVSNNKEGNFDKNNPNYGQSSQNDLNYRLLYINVLLRIIPTNIFIVRLWTLRCYIAIYSQRKGNKK